jgi:Tfp pilus assembly protein PilV
MKLKSIPFPDKDSVFTLVEVMIAMTILPFGILDIASMNTSTVQVNTTAMNMLAAANIIQERLEEMSSMGLNAVNYFIDQNENGANGDGNTPDYSQVDLKDGQTYTIDWNVSQDYPINNTNTIRIHIIWNDGTLN